MRGRHAATAQRAADWAERRRRIRFFGGMLDELGYDRAAVELRELDEGTRRRFAKRGLIGAGVIVGVAKILIGFETFVAALLAFNGGTLNLHTAPDYPADMGMVLIGLLVGTVISVVASIAFLLPQYRWFIRADPTDKIREWEVRSVPRKLVVADLFGWVAALVVYAGLSEQRGVFVLAVAGAFGLAAITSGSLTYLFGESSSRPLAILALHGDSVDGVLHSVRARLFVVWMVSSAVPMIGLLLINLGRGLDWLPPVAGTVDWTSVLLAVVALTSGVRVVGLVDRAITGPLKEMREVIEAARIGDFGRRVAVYDASEIGILQAGLNSMLDGLVERERMRDIFSRHVGDRVAKLALEQDGELVGTNTDVAVIFVDITGSTAFAADRDPRETAVVLNAFFSIVGDVVDRHDGFINKFEGDAALMIFGAPTSLDDPALAALAAARELGSELGEKLPLEWGMGVSFGQVFAGNIGARNRYEYTVIGDPVNEAARLSDRAKEGYAPVYASRAAVEAAADEEGECWSRVDRVVLRGRSHHTEVYAATDLLVRSEPPSLGSVLADLVKFALPAMPGDRTSRTPTKES
ncbi:adenylate/guanylate cyclase domain-containing protein [Gordonia zhaorongruii]|uniref:adenylate/guanylate cyclase domain-containing protein n=1 Tax=Gordonia zhaorongruii TaxID=2597659 RepID=UPI001044D435|nr:adenylate/guanylate cyclase domain-containing protein [Gordonia zhaorongruii]